MSQADQASLLHMVESILLEAKHHGLDNEPVYSLILNITFSVRVIIRLTEMKLDHIVSNKTQIEIVITYIS